LHRLGESHLNPRTVWIELTHLERSLSIIGPHFKLRALCQRRTERDMPGRHATAALDDHGQRSTDDFTTLVCNKSRDLLHDAVVAISPLRGTKAVRRSAAGYKLSPPRPSFLAN
jgi:hypothetical protein